MELMKKGDKYKLHQGGEWIDVEIYENPGKKKSVKVSANGSILTRERDALIAPGKWESQRLDGIAGLINDELCEVWRKPPASLVAKHVVGETREEIAGFHPMWGPHTESVQERPRVRVLLEDLDNLARDSEQLRLLKREVEKLVALKVTAKRELDAAEFIRLTNLSRDALTRV
jgi:hypothetical protein